MWLFTLMGISIVIGTVLGLVWYVSENWLERRASRKQLEIELSNDISQSEAQPISEKNYSEAKVAN